MDRSEILPGLRRSWNRAKWRMRGLDVYALVGRSGTGKSFRARLVADTHGIEAILDDGLLIHAGRILAGRSAKKESQRLAAVKTALFHRPEHRDSVARALREGAFRKILLLGTSERMVLRNCRTLGLPPPREIFRIEDVATTEEIDLARRDRARHGRHVIPLPVIEIRKAYPKMVAEAIRVWFQRGMHRLAQDKAYEKTVVRPGFHNKGSITITEAAMAQMVLHCLRERAPELEATKIRVKRHAGGHRIRIELTAPYGSDVARDCADLRAYVIDKIESYTGLAIERLSLQVNAIEGAPSVAPDNTPPQWDTVARQPD